VVSKNQTLSSREGVEMGIQVGKRFNSVCLVKITFIIKYGETRSKGMTRLFPDIEAAFQGSLGLFDRRDVKLTSASNRTHQTIIIWPAQI
jgi:hypothetical protein